MPMRREARSPWTIEDVFPQLDQFIGSAQIVTARTGDKIWVRVFPGIAFCSDHRERKVQPAGIYLSKPLRPDQVWFAFLRLPEQEGLAEKLERLKPKPGPLTTGDLIGDDYLPDDPDVAVFVSNHDRHAQAEAAVLRYLGTALQELNRRIVDTLGIESWINDAEAVLRDLRLDASAMSAGDHDQLVSAIAARWDLFAPYLADAASDRARESGPATLYLIAMCSACAAQIREEGGCSSRMKKQTWASATLDAVETSPHVRLKRAVAHTGTTHPVIRAAWRLGGESVRILAGNAEPRLAFEQCIHGLELAIEVGPQFGEAFLREIEAAEPRWRRLPAWILRRMATHALSRQGTDDYERMLGIELSCVVDALGDAQCGLGSLPQNLGWPGIVSVASYLEWDNSLPAYCDSGYEIWPLVNSTELQEEGKAMRNCVKEYDLLCASEIARVFSIRHQESASRVATALIMREGADMTWQLAQVKGPRNHPAPPAIRDVASRIASLYNQREAQTASLDRLAMTDKVVAKLPRMPTGGLVID